MDWSCLRRLDLNHGAPKHLFSVLTGKVPKLRALHFGFWPNHSPDRTWECLDVSVIVKLLESIHGLQQLEATNMNMAEFQNILNDPVFAKLGRTLKMLRVSFTAAAAKGWTLDDVQSMTESCPGLQVLGLKIAMETDTTVPYTSTIWPVAAIEKLKCLTQLRELSLVLQLDENSTEFIVASDGNQHIIKPAAQDRTLSLIRNWRASQRGSELKKCVVRYQTILPFTEHAYTVTSSGTLDSPLELQTDVTGLPAVISLHPFY
ncbi:hypothetical protein EJ04DRAFT_565041 [Polyplosphaeria fusca]|uniref:Uncharacterized protein n=1 Tax=Polyplosphaeria fusca TaxID=682080 RepID=A0A9P4QYH1_9PLEO|nr:hypothetical protein EJ04DRAFT_565041 [Polyplosphaeria fusca]